MALYKGFSTIVSSNPNRWKLEDTELVKRDILNHFQTRRGERLSNPAFGSRIWEFAFEPMSDDLRDAILDDVRKILQAEPRVVSRDVTVREFQNGFQIEMDLYFTEQDVSQAMYVQFNQQAQIMTSI